MPNPCFNLYIHLCHERKLQSDLDSIRDWKINSSLYRQKKMNMSLFDEEMMALANKESECICSFNLIVARKMCISLHSNDSKNEEWFMLTQQIQAILDVMIKFEKDNFIIYKCILSFSLLLKNNHKFRKYMKYSKVIHQIHEAYCRHFYHVQIKDVIELLLMEILK